MAIRKFEDLTTAELEHLHDVLYAEWNKNLCEESRDLSTEMWEEVIRRKEEKAHGTG
jgi:hypothetical protein